MQLQQIHDDLRQRAQQGLPTGVPAPDGYVLEFESFPGFPLLLKSLETARGIALVAVRQVDQTMFATVYVPYGETKHFLNRVEQFLTRDTPSGKPQNAPLVSSIAGIRLAVARSFWTDDPAELPKPDEVVWWEVWLRGEDHATLQRFKALAHATHIRVSNEHLTFPDRIVILAEASLTQFSDSIALLDALAELRRARDLASFFIRLPTDEQTEWADDLRHRIEHPNANAPAVCILDTGVAQGHPLLRPFLSPEDMHAFDPSWRTHDHHGHGTEMAGVSLFGDLKAALTSRAPITLTHRLESGKIHPPPPDTNERKLYGAVTAGTLSRVERAAPRRRRVVALATTGEDCDGRPSSWSAALDRLAAGVEDGERRLFLVSAGNIRGPNAGLGYRVANELARIEDPAQSWNALTVGAYTDLVVHDFDHADTNAWRCIASKGELGPTSRTSCKWESQWPLKPEVVMEGGNMLISPEGTTTDGPLALSVLTTDFQPAVRLFRWAGDTSAATAAAAHLAATVRTSYPDFWDETIRALIVDSAEWTPSMTREVGMARGPGKLERLLRCYGYGVPQMERALWSAASALTLIVQDEIQPFSGDASNEMHLHRLPWPVQSLQALGGQDVELRVTLSYFVEPSPSRNGIWKERHRYHSHGLRFQLQRPAESEERFRKRVNAAEREDGDGDFGGDADGWLLKTQLRSKGSLHHDRWTGPAASLATRELLAVYPVVGWWRKRPNLGRSESKARYSLVVTIRTPATGIDIYAEVANKIGIPVAVQT